MNINERVREVRSALGLTQKEFGQKITLAQTYLSQIEKGDRDVTEKIRKLLCLQFNVNEEWLLTGNGSMFLEDDNSLLSQLSIQYNLDEFSRRFIQTFIQLPASHREVIKDFAASLFDDADSKNSSSNLEEVQKKKFMQMAEDQYNEEKTPELQVSSVKESDVG